MESAGRIRLALKAASSLPVRSCRTGGAGWGASVSPRWAGRRKQPVPTERNIIRVDSCFDDKDRIFTNLYGYARPARCAGRERGARPLRWNGNARAFSTMGRDWRSFRTPGMLGRLVPVRDGRLGPAPTVSLKWSLVMPKESDGPALLLRRERGNERGTRTCKRPRDHAGTTLTRWSEACLIASFAMLFLMPSLHLHPRRNTSAGESERGAARERNRRRPYDAGLRVGTRTACGSGLWD